MSTDLTRIGERLGENSEELSEEPDVWEIRLSGFCEGLGNDRRYGQNIVAPPGNQTETEKTNLGLKPWKTPVYSTFIHFFVEA